MVDKPHLFMSTVWHVFASHRRFSNSVGAKPQASASNFAPRTVAFFLQSHAFEMALMVSNHFFILAVVQKKITNEELKTCSFFLNPNGR
jgi:hypothetical protein